jgi:hypothetical protein
MLDIRLLRPRVPGSDSGRSKECSGGYWQLADSRMRVETPEHARWLSQILSDSDTEYYS